MGVLIFSYWNVDIVLDRNSDQEIGVLIFSYWNVGRSLTALRSRRRVY